MYNTAQGGISISDVITKNASLPSAPSVKPEFKESHYLKRIVSRPSPPRNARNPELVDCIIGREGVIQILKDESPFVWDGSHLGTICGYNILEQVEYTGIKYWRMEIFGHREVCIVRTMANSTPCVCDELKVFFGLSKLGTHSITYRSKKYLLIKARLDKRGRIIEEITIDKVDPNKNENFLRRVQETFTFRDLLGLIMTRDRSIVVRWSEESYIPPYPVSFYESDMRPYQNGVVSNVAEKRWFGEVSMNETLKSMLKITSDPDIVERITYLRDNIEKIIERIDREMIWMVQPLIEKLTRRLTSESEKGLSPTPDWE